MIFNINCGHTLEGFGSGAVGFINESRETRILGNRIISLLEKMGHSVIDSTVNYAKSTNDSLKKIIDKTNNKHCDYFVSIHFNAGKGTGSEIYLPDNAFYNDKTIKPEYKNASEILKKLNKLGLKNRGNKNGSHLYVIRKNIHKAMLIEVCFVDNKSDTELYLKNIDNIAIAIVEGLTGEKVVNEEKCTLAEFEEARKELKKLGITDGTKPLENITREQV